MAKERPALCRLARRLRDDAQGNILVMTAVGLLTLCFAFGFAVDFSRAEAAQTELNAIADAAALAAVDPSMIYQSDATAKAAAVAMCDAFATPIPIPTSNCTPPTRSANCLVASPPATPSTASSRRMIRSVHPVTL
jgi:Flp pilus assembly protein TadG